MEVQLAASSRKDVNGMNYNNLTCDFEGLSGEMQIHNNISSSADALDIMDMTEPNVCMM